jgi:hypothetical protein
MGLGKMLADRSSSLACARQSEAGEMKTVRAMIAKDAKGEGNRSDHPA